MTIDITQVPDTDTDKKLAFALCQKFTKARQDALKVDKAQSIRKWDHQAMHNLLVNERSSSGMSPMQQAQEIGEVMEFVYGHPLGDSWIQIVDHPEAFTKQYLDIATSWLRANTVQALAGQAAGTDPVRPADHIGSQTAHTPDEWDQIHFENTGDAGEVEPLAVTPDSPDPERMLHEASTEAEARAAMHEYTKTKRRSLV
jgi:hypothetical protein